MTMLSDVLSYQREVRGFWRAGRSFADFLAMMRVRLARSKVGRLVCARPRSVCVDVSTLGRDIHLRSHTTDISVLAELVLNRGYDCLLPFMERPPLRIIDLGANIGLASRWFLARWPEARITAVEPEAGNVALLRRNLPARRPGVDVIQACIGGTARRAALRRGNGAWACEMIEADDADATDDLVDVITMSTLLGDDEEFDLLKCDIEGSERELFETCRAWVGRIRMAIVECHGCYGSEDLLADVRANGGDFEIVHREPKNGFDCEVVVLRRVRPNVRGTLRSGHPTEA